MRTEAAAAALKRLSRHGGRGGSMLPAGLSFPEAGAGAASPAASHRQGQTASAATLLLCGDLCPTAETTGSVPAPPPAPGPWVCDQGVGTSASVRGWAPQPDSSDTIINTSTTTSTNQSHTGVRHQTGDESMEDDMTI